MAFKKRTSVRSVPDCPSDLFRSLTRRNIPDVMTHQRDMLRDYKQKASETPNVALQLPTGSGKTLVGLLIAEWRLRKFNNRVVYLCPTRQLVNQTVEQAQNLYGIDVEGFIGPKSDYSASAKTNFLTGERVAITTYSSLFNNRPFFLEPDIIIVDDAHTAENYIAKMWSLNVFARKDSHKNLHAAISGHLREYLSRQSYARLIGDWEDRSDATWVDMLSPKDALDVAPTLVEVIDTHARSCDEFEYPWQLIRDHLSACQIYLASREILIRPLIPPVWSHPPYANAKQRIFMSATLGADGDLERLTGTSSIERLQASESFRSAGVGRRYFIFPNLSLSSDESEGLRLESVRLAERALILTPSEAQANIIRDQLEDLKDFKILGPKDLEEAKDQFSSSVKVVAILPGRFDGIDFPHDECRFLCLDGLPGATNAQERFLTTRMGAVALYKERVQTRVLQAVGRCTRALQDRSAIFVTGSELTNYLADNRNWVYLDPELQSELDFGVMQSKKVSSDAIVENLKSFLQNDEEWVEANDQILAACSNFIRQKYPAIDQLSKVVKFEIEYSKALWSDDIPKAYQTAREITTLLTASELVGYRALWHCISGSTALKLALRDERYSAIAREQFEAAKGATSCISWLAELSNVRSNEKLEEQSSPSEDVISQVERLEEILLKFGTVNERGFEKKVKYIIENLADSKRFEEGQRALGELLGFESGNADSDAAPDPWWIGKTRGIVFEDHAEGDGKSRIGANKARQAATHQDWLKHNFPHLNELVWHSILVTPSKSAMSGAKPTLKKVLLWPLDEFEKWASKAIQVVRELKKGLPPSSNLEWRKSATERLITEKLTMQEIVKNLKFAADHLNFEGEDT